MRRLSCTINSYESEQQERILKSSKSTLLPEAHEWESTLDLVGLEVCFPVIEEIPRRSDILVCKWRVI